MAEIAIIIATRNRGAQAAEAAVAVLRDPADLELVVVDQSTDEATAQALAALPADPRLRVVRSSQRGLSNARNTGVAATSAPILAFTDDDCRPEPGWATALLGAFRQDPLAGLVFGRVRLPLGALDRGYGASFEPERRVVEGGVPLPDVGLGIGANFGIRRPLLEHLGGFDPLLGIGAPYFRAGEETDVVLRALHEGHRVLNSPECDVLHLGVRNGADAHRLAVGYQISTGAAFGKLARLSGVSGARTAGRWAIFYAARVVREIASLRRPRPGVLVYFVAGALLTYRYRVDRRRQVFQPRSGTRASRLERPTS